MVITALTRKRVTILEASPENVLIFQGFRGIVPQKTFRFSLLVFSPISGLFRRSGTHNLTCSGIEAVITRTTRKRVTILEASPENVLIFQGFRGIVPQKTFRFSLLVFSPISGLFRRSGTHNLTCSGIEAVITRTTRNRLVGQKPARGFESHPLRHTSFLAEIRLEAGFLLDCAQSSL